MPSRCTFAGALSVCAALSLAGCGDDDAAPARDPDRSPPAVSIDAPSGPDIPFAGTRWRVAGFVGEGGERRAPSLATRYEITFAADGDTFSAFDGCDTFAGTTNASDDSYRLERHSGAEAIQGGDGDGCEGEGGSIVRAERAAIEATLFDRTYSSLDGSTLTLSSLLFAAVPESAVPTALEPAIPDGGRVDFRVLDEGDGGALVGGLDAEASFKVLRDRRALLERRARLGKGEVDPSEPDVDFTRHAVLYASMGTRGSGGWSIEPVSLVRRDGYTDVTLHFVSPGPGCAAEDQITEPWIMLELATLAQAVRVDALDVEGPSCDGSAVTAPGPAHALDPERLAVRALDIVPVPLDGAESGAARDGYARVVPDRDALAALLPVTPAATAVLDDIDFDAETIVDVSFGFAPSSGHDIRVADARGGDALVLDVLRIVPGEGCAEDAVIEYPRQLARVPLAGPRVVFIERTRARAPCEADLGDARALTGVRWNLIGYRTRDGEDVAAAYSPPYALTLSGEESAIFPLRVFCPSCGQLEGDFLLDGVTLTTLDVTDAGESISCDGVLTGDSRTDVFLTELFVGTRQLAVDVTDGVLTLSSPSGSLARFLADRPPRRAPGSLGEIDRPSRADG